VKSKKKNKPAEAIKSSNNRIKIYFFLLVAVPFVLYFRIANYEFSTMDDNDMITAVYNVSGSFGNIKEAFTHDAFMSNSGNSFYRPVQTISFMIDSQFGSLQPGIYHFSNLIWHILMIIALFFFLRMLGVKDEISFLLTLIFSVNPLLTHAVAWIPARGDLLVGLFGLLSFITFLNYIEKRRTFYLILHALFFLLAVFSKETAVLLPIVIFTYYYFVIRKESNLKEILPFLLIWVISIIVFYFSRRAVITNNITSNIFGVIPFIKNLPVIPITFGKFFVPFNLSTLPKFDMPSIVIGFLLIVTVIILAYKFIPSKNRIVIWGAIWFLSFTIPPMFLRIPSSDIGFEYFEYRAYLPVIGILVILGFLGNKFLKIYSFNEILMVIIPIVLLYGITAYVHSSAFSSPLSFFSSGVEASAKNAYALNSRGGTFRDAGNIEPALADFDNCIRVCPTYSCPYFSKGDLYRNTGDYQKAEYFYALALKYDTLYKNINTLQDNAYMSLSAIKLILNKYGEAVAILKKADIVYPGSQNILNNMGYAYNSLGKYDSALVCFNRAIKIDPEAAAFQNNRAKAKYHLKDFNGSMTDFNKAIKLDPGLDDAYLNRGILKTDINDYEGAISDFNMVLNLNAQSGEAFYHRGIAYSKINKPAEAEKDKAEALKLGFKETSGEKEN